jgi:hypothetical protein
MKCPGQDPRYWKFDAIFEAECPKCRASVEFFKDETRRKCPKCGHRTLNPNMDFGCAAHCKFAEACFGDLPPELVRQKKEMFKDRVAIEVKKRFGKDFKSISKSVKTARLCEKLMERISGDPAIIISAAHLLGIVKRQDGETAIHGPSEGVQEARSILEALDADKELTDEVCDILDKFQRGAHDESTNYLVVHDAATIREILDNSDHISSDDNKLIESLKANLFTTAGIELALEEIREQMA